MSSRRAQKVAEAIREVVSMAILTDLRDPRVRGVTVTYVEASDDLRYAKVHVSVMGDETAQNLTLRGLESAGGFLQSKVAARLELRYTPRLSFILDQGVKRSIEVAKILQRVLPPPPAGEETGEEEAGEDDAVGAELEQGAGEDEDTSPGDEDPEKPGDDRSAS